MTLIVLEGPDATGKSTILNSLKERYKDNNRVKFLYFPSDGKWGKVADFLMTYMKPLFMWFPMLGALPFLKDFRAALKDIQEDDIVISSRWYHSTMAYESIYKEGYAQYIFIRKVIFKCKKYNLPAPTKVFYLTLPKKKHEEVLLSRDDSRHFFEKSMALQDKIENAYHKAFIMTDAKVSYINNSFLLTNNVVESICEKIDSLM